MSDPTGDAPDPAAAKDDKVQEEADEGIFCKDRIVWDLSPELIEKLRDQFERYDIDESGFIDTTAELNLLATNVAYLAFSDPFNLNVSLTAACLHGC